MTVPQPSFGPLGFVAPAEPDILVAVKEEINAAFDNTLNMADETPQGQIAVSQTAAIGNANDSFVFLSQMFDPAYSQGRYQDALARIYFLSRQGAEPTAVVCTVTGLAGVVIPAGSFAQDQAGNLYVATSEVTIEAGGSASVTFANTVPGPTPCPANTLNVIYQAINGWDTITNPADGVIGRDTETRQEFELRRFASVEANSRGTLSAIRGAVLELPGVLDCYVTENVSNSIASVGGVTLAPHSLYVAVTGGNINEIAETIWRKKAPGCAYNGNTSVTVQDSNSGYNPPYPSYAVFFQVPDALPVVFKVNLQNNPLIPADAATLIQQAIIAATAGADGGPRMTIGSEIFASRFYNAVVSLGPWAQLRTILIGSTQAPDASFTASISGTTMTVTAMASGVIALGGLVFGSTVIDGTSIVSQSTGSPGGTGTYVVSASQTVASAALKSVSATLTTIVPDIDVAPATSAPEILVSIT